MKRNRRVAPPAEAKSPQVFFVELAPYLLDLIGADLGTCVGNDIAETNRWMRGCAITAGTSSNKVWAQQQRRATAAERRAGLLALCALWETFASTESFSGSNFLLVFIQSRTFYPGLSEGCNRNPSQTSMPPSFVSSGSGLVHPSFHRQMAE